MKIVQNPLLSVLISGFSGLNEKLLLPLVTYALVMLFISVFGTIISVGVIHLSARASGGAGTYWQLYYAIAAYMAPLLVFLCVLGVIPVVNYLANLVGLYMVVLNVTAVKTVYKFSWGKAFGTNFLIPVVIGVLMLIVLMAILGT